MKKNHKKNKLPQEKKSFTAQTNFQTNQFKQISNKTVANKENDQGAKNTNNTQKQKSKNRPKNTIAKKTNRYNKTIPTDKQKTKQQKIKQQKTNHKTKQQISSKNKKRTNQWKIIYSFIVLFCSLLIIWTISKLFLSRHNISNTKINQNFQPQLNILTDKSIWEQLQQTATETTTTPTQHIQINNKKTILNNKYLIILKRGKLFSFNLTTRKYTDRIEISPIPTKEHEAIHYQQVIPLDNGTIMTTGYRPNNKSTEISFFQLTPVGTWLRKDVYDFPGNISKINTSNNKLSIHTIRPFTSVPFDTISSYQKWHNKNFQEYRPLTSTIFYEMSSSDNNAYLHSFTTCIIDNFSLQNCQQQHLVENSLSAENTQGNTFYLWFNREILKDNPHRQQASALLYKISPPNPPQIIPVEGQPLDRQAIIIDPQNTTLTSIVYQNNNFPPLWLPQFQSDKIATFRINTENLSSTISSENYTNLYSVQNEFTLPPEKVKYLAPEALLNLLTEQDIIFLQQNSIANIELPGKIIFVKAIPNTDKYFVLYNNNKIPTAGILSKTTPSLFNDKISLPKFDLAQDEIITSEFFSFKNNQNTFISLPIYNKQNKQGTLFLFKLNQDNLSLIYQLPYTNKLQLKNDACQNDCQEGINNVLSFDNYNKYIFASVGSYLKFFIQKNNQLKLSLTTPYTFKPKPPKPKLPTARKPVGAKIVNGKYVCKKKHDYVGKSKKKNKGYIHLDLECCLDPDEYPNPWCTYRPGELSVTKYRYKDYHGRIKIKKH